MIEALRRNYRSLPQIPKTERAGLAQHDRIQILNESAPKSGKRPGRAAFNRKQAREIYFAGVELLSEELVFAFVVFFVVVFFAPFLGVLAVVVVLDLSVVDVVEPWPKAKPAPSARVIVNISSFFMHCSFRGILSQ
jgi:hypothetical protein